MPSNSSDLPDTDPIAPTPTDPLPPPSDTLPPPTDPIADPVDVSENLEVLCADVINEYKYLIEDGLQQLDDAKTMMLSITEQYAIIFNSSFDPRVPTVMTTP